MPQRNNYNVIQRLKKVQSVCQTMDLWSNRQMKSYIGITGHHILDYAMQSVMLDCKRFVGRHTADNIYREYHETVVSANSTSRRRSPTA